MRPSPQKSRWPESSSGSLLKSALGLAIGISLAIVFEVFQMAAQAISLQAGLGYASTIDPSSGADSTVLLTMAQLTAALLFFASGADRLLVKALAESLRLAPPESFTVNKTWALAIIQFGGTIFSSGLRLAAPLIALLLLADVSLAILGRVQQQLHLISLTMPLKLAATMLILVGDDGAAAWLFRVAHDDLGASDRGHTPLGPLEKPGEDSHVSPQSPALAPARSHRFRNLAARRLAAQCGTGFSL